MHFRLIFFNVTVKKIWNFIKSGVLGFIVQLVYNIGDRLNLAFFADPNKSGAWRIFAQRYAAIF
jgi:hypothetical protein